MREEPKSLAEWLEHKGNPKHHIANGDNGSMVIAIEEKASLTPELQFTTSQKLGIPMAGNISGWDPAGVSAMNTFPLSVIC